MVDLYFKYCQLLYGKCGLRFSNYQIDDEYSAELRFWINRVSFINTLYDFPASDHPKAIVEIRLEPDIQCYKAVLINERGKFVRETVQVIREIIALEIEKQKELKHDRLSAV